MLLSLQSLEADIFQNTVNQWFFLLHRCVSALGDRLNLLGDQLLAVHSNVLEENVRDKSILTLGSQKVDLGDLVQVLELWLALNVELVKIFLVGFKEEVLSFGAHDLDLTGDSFVHFFLSLNSFFSVEFLGNLSNF